jgi:hypothetical protein
MRPAAEAKRVVGCNSAREFISQENVAVVRKDPLQKASETPIANVEHLLNVAADAIKTAKWLSRKQNV